MQRKRILYAAGAIALVLASWAVWRAFFAANANELPASWVLAEIAKATPPYGSTGPVHVLAWKVYEDDRPLRVESCLVLRVLDDDEGYQVSQLCRSAGNPEWRLSEIHVSGAPGTKYWPGLWMMHTKRFAKRPTNEELYAALASEDLWWRFELEDGWRYVDCRVCERTWREVLDDEPTQLFTQKERSLLERLHLDKWFGGGR